MLDYISYDVTRSHSPAMFRLMQAMDRFMKDSKESQQDLAPYLALGLIDGLEAQMLQMADTDDPNSKGALRDEAIDAVAYQLHMKGQTLQAFINLAVETGTLKKEEMEDEDGRKITQIWSPAVERSIREWQKVREARINGGRNSHKGKSENGDSDDGYRKLSPDELQEYQRLQKKYKDKGFLPPDEKQRMNDLAIRAVMTHQIAQGVNQ